MNDLDGSMRQLCGLMEKRGRENRPDLSSIMIGPFTMSPFTVIGESFRQLHLIAQKEFRMASW